MKAGILKDWLTLYVIDITLSYLCDIRSLHHYLKQSNGAFKDTQGKHMDTVSYGAHLLFYN